MSLMPPPENGRRTYGYYDVESTLGRGAMGMVYLARDRRIGRHVALKTIQIEQLLDEESTATEFYKRLQREAELSGALHHPNIVTLYEAGYEDDRIVFLATEYVAGETLKERLKKTKPLPLGLALSIAEDVLRGLAYAHARGIVHRDIKPANILLNMEDQAKIADFGIARPHDSTLTGAGALLGTPNYMSPEQVKATTVSPRSDLFSHGIVMYEMLTGIKPFAADDLSGILQKVLHFEPELASSVNSAVPVEVARFVQKLLGKSPEQRFPSTQLALDELKKLRSLVGDTDLTPPPAAEGSATMRPSEWSAPTVKESDITPLLFRHVAQRTAWGILTTILGAILLAIAIARLEIDKPLRALIPLQQREEFASKKASLEKARQLLEQQRYDESIHAFDQYLARYPYSLAAKEGREEAIRARDEAKPHKARATVPVQTAAEKPKEQPPPPSRWERIKRWFRRE